jgi:hypothetical protein
MFESPTSFSCCRYKQWILNIRESKKIIQKAEFRAYQELRSALDSAGHVYVLGSGAYGQFAAPGLPSMDTKRFKFEFFDKVLELWRDRVQPQQLIDRLGLARKHEQQEAERDEGRNLSALGAVTKQMNQKKVRTAVNNAAGVCCGRLGDHLPLDVPLLLLCCVYQTILYVIFRLLYASCCFFLTSTVSLFFVVLCDGCVFLR